MNTSNHTNNHIIMSRIDLGQNIRSPRTVPATAEGFLSLASDAPTSRICAGLADLREQWLRGEITKEEYREQKARMKQGLHFYTPHAHFRKGYKRSDGDPVDSGKAVLDLDGCEGFRQMYAERLKGRESQLGVNMANVSASGTGGHVLFDIPQGMTRQEAQAWMAQEMGGADYDKAVHELERAIYIPCRDYILYIDEERMFGDAVSPVVVAPRPTEASHAEAPSGERQEAARCFKGIPYSSIIAEWWNRNGGEPAEGERNVKLHRLAVNLRAICDNRSEVLMQVVPRFGLSEAELRAVVDSACKEPPKGVSKVMQQIIDTLGQEDASEQAAEQPQEGDVATVSVRTLPIGLKESLAGVPPSMHMPVLCSVMPIAAAYADQVTAEYCDGNVHRLGLMSIIRGDQASNKSVCKGVVDVWKRQFDEEDALARRREDEWKERKKSRKANEKAPEDPRVLIRQVPVTVSCSTLLKRLKNAHGHTIYSFGEELDTLRKTNGAGSWSSKYDIYRLSFDNGEWGQDYNSDQAESGVVNVAYNWTMLGTYGAMRRCFKSDNIENGLSSRILVAEMPDSAFQKMPKFGRRSAGDEARIQQAVTRLRCAAGLVDVPRLRRAIEAWVEEKRVEAAKDIDHVKDTYRKRAAVIGFRCGVVFHILTGYKHETKACLDFARTMAEYCLQQQMKAFGEAMRNQQEQAEETSRRSGANHSVFDSLPPTFTIDDLRTLKRGYCGERSMSTIISRWKHDGWIEKTDARHWTKTTQQ